MKILFILKIFILLFAIAFSLAALYILIVFAFNLRKNAVLNKSVSKSVFKGKTSLIIILLFFGVSFSFVGGMQLTMTAGNNSIVETFNKEDVWQYEFTNDSIFDSGDDTLNKMYEYYLVENKEEHIEYKESLSTLAFENAWISFINTVGGPNTWNSDYVYSDLNQSYIDFTHLKKGNFPKKMNEIEVDRFKNWLIDKDYIIEKNLDDYIFVKSSYFTIAAENEVFSWFLSLDENKQNALSILFKNDLNKLTNFLFNSYLIEKIKNSSHIEGINEQYAIDVRGYYHFVPKNLGPNEEYEFVVFPDLIKEQSVSKTVFSNGTYKDFINAPQENSNIYNVVVQEDYMQANGLKSGDYINLFNGIKLKIYDTVRFSEITYGMMGANFIVDESKQAFIGIKASDYINMISSISEDQYISLYNRYLTFFVHDKTLSKLISDEWVGNKTTLESKRNNFFSDSVQQFNIENSFIRLNSEEANEIFSNTTGGHNYISEGMQYNWNRDGPNGEFVGIPLKKNGLSPIYSYETIESFRALTGLNQIKSTQTVIYFLVIVFMVIILIVLSMLIAKRINNSGKQLGTLKAIGMSNRQIASSYILFPLIIVGLGFVIAALVSPLVMMLLSNMLKNYYYITFLAMPLSIGFFWTILIIPMLLSVGLGYFISIRVLRKPTLDLLSNKGKEAPNIFVRAAGYVTPEKTPFVISYAGKGVLKAMGKSMLLFVSVFLSVFLTAFAMSTTTMIENQTKTIMSYLNFDAIGLQQNGNYNNFKYQDMYDTNGNLSYVNTFPGSDNELLVKFSWIGDDKNDSSSFVQKLFDEAESHVLDYNNSNGIESFYISSQSMLILTFAEFFWYENGLGQKEITSLINSWLTQSVEAAYNYYETSEEPTLKKFIPLLPDVVVGDYYANQYRDSVIATMDFKSQVRSYFDPNYNSYKELVKDDFLNNNLGKGYSMFSVLSSQEQFLNSWGSKEKIGEQVWNNSFAKEGWKIGQEEPSQVWDKNYIPVIITTQSKLLLEKWANHSYTDSDGKKINFSNKIVDGKDTYYDVSLDLNTKLISNNPSKYKDIYAAKVPITIRIKVVEELFLGINFGVTTQSYFLDGYLKNYASHWQGQLDLSNSYGNYTVANNLETISKDYTYSPSYTYRYSPQRLEIPEQKAKYSPLSLVPTVDSYNKIMNETKKINGKDIFDPTVGFETYDANGNWIKVDTIISQGAKIYDIIMVIFMFMSIFIVFMATTVIVIAMKDVIDSSRREVSMLKAFGYSSFKATFLIMIPYVVISALAFFVALPMTFLGLAGVASVLTTLTGNVFVFTLTTLQWFLVILYVYGLIGLLTVLGFISFYRTNALEAIRTSDE